MDRGAEPLADAALRGRVSDLDALHLELARKDPNAFATYVLRDEATGGRAIQSRNHILWHRLLDAHKRVLVWSHVESGKSSQVSVGRVLYELGRNPNLRVAIVSNTDVQAQKLCLTIGKYITDSAAYRRVFPHVERDRGRPWTMHKIYLRRSTQARDPSVQTCGIHGNILGSRIDLLVLDDLLDYENTLSQNQRDDLWHWHFSTLETRLDARARIWCVGTAWHPDDFMHRYAKVHRVAARRFPVLDEEGRPTWPERWPPARVEEARKVLGPLEFSRQLMCVARSDEDSRFRRADVECCVDRGEGTDPIWALTSVPPGFSTYTGVDIGIGTKKGSALTALFTIAIHPDGSRQVLWCESGRWSGDEIVRRIIDAHHRYKSVVIVEAIAAQKFVLDITKKVSSVPVEPYYTSGKDYRHWEFGIESMAVEMANGKWIIPSRGGKLVPELESWRSELMYYDPKGHPGDRLMSSYFARQGSMKRKPAAGVFRQSILRR